MLNVIARPAFLTSLRLAALALCLGATQAAAQENGSEEAARRQAALAAAPKDAAKRLFGLATSPAPGPARAIGFYSKGCLAGGVALPTDGPTWQVMRLSRNRNWGHPALVSFVERLANRVPSINGWPGLLIGDMGQPRGGPMLTGHASHQIGLDADIWLTPMPVRRLTTAERENVPATNMVAGDWNSVDPATWTPQHTALIKTVAKMGQVERIFVNPAIKRALCQAAGSDRGWLSKVRPMYGHNYHFHVRLACPRGESACRSQEGPPGGDGCGPELDWWFSYEARHPKPTPPAPPLKVADLPPACRQVIEAP